MNINYYFDPARKQLICRYCGRGFLEFLSLNDHMKKKHYQMIATKRVIE